MSTAALHIALVGNPNCGKTALFNLLTGTRQKVANYAGVTIERKEGHYIAPSGRAVRVLDLPGAYSLAAASPDEAITRDVIAGRYPGEAVPDLLVCVADATNLRLHLRFVLELKRLGLPMVLALNMMDAAARRGIRIDRAALQRALGIPVIETIAVKHGGARGLVAEIDKAAHRPSAIGNLDDVSDNAHHAPDLLPMPRSADESGEAAFSIPDSRVLIPGASDLHAQVRAILGATVTMPERTSRRDDAIDRIVLHPVLGLGILAVVMFLIFQAVFSWATPLHDAIDDGMTLFGAWLGGLMPAGALRSLIVDGVIAGAGAVLVFLPQILILFLFILCLEESGYLPRAAFLLDRMMLAAGLTGRSFIPLLSSFACAIPGIMATRSIADPRDRLTTILVAPLMTCSARLPVYTLLIAALIPARSVGGIFNLQGVVLFTLYVAGIVSALGVAWVIKRLRRDKSEHALLMELPSYRMPHPRDIAIGLYERGMIFLKRVGGIILALTVLLWFLSNFPAPPAGATEPAINYSLAGILGRGLQTIFAPLGFNWQICVALIPGLAAREVAVSSLATVYALGGNEDGLQAVVAAQWSLATALSLLAWYVFAPMCISTLATVRRETNSWRNVIVLAGYLFGLAYLASLATYQIARALS
jgi:ferrous iron transport protein B